MRVTSISSASPTGRKVASRLSSSRKKSSGLSSSSRKSLLARRPWRRRLRLEAALPSGVHGPVDFLAFSRLARMRASVRGRGLLVFIFIFVWAGAEPGPHLDVRGGGLGRRGTFAPSRWKQGDGLFCEVVND